MGFEFRYNIIYKLKVACAYNSGLKKFEISSLRMGHVCNSHLYVLEVGKIDSLGICVIINHQCSFISSERSRSRHSHFLSLCLCYRLLDICHGQRHEREMSLFLVFEHVHQDLAQYLERCPPPGLGQDNIKVSVETL